ncbi:MAG TPA: hypothetical protein VHE79_16005, partial [Spirochaetia bacterium]
ALRAEGGGVLGIFDRGGACVRAAAGTSDRSLLVMLPRGDYTALTRPLAGAGAAGGLVTLRALAAVPIESDGEGDPVLIGARDQSLYRFTVRAPGRVGCGIRAQSDTLSAALFDGRFTQLGTGRIFVRDLTPGTYYLLVSAGGTPQRYAPVVYGLAGERTDVPDSIVKSYRGE